MYRCQFVMGDDCECKRIQLFLSVDPFYERSHQSRDCKWFRWAKFATRDYNTRFAVGAGGCIPVLPYREPVQFADINFSKRALLSD